MNLDSDTQQPEMGTSLEFIETEYELKEAAKKDLKALGERLNFLSARVDEMVKEIDNLVQPSYSFNIKMVEVSEIAKTGSKDTTKLCVRTFQAIGCNTSINDIDIAHREPVRDATNGPKPIIWRFVRRLTREEVMSRRREIFRVHPKCVDLGDAADLSTSTLLGHLTPEV